MLSHFYCIRLHDSFILVVMARIAIDARIINSSTGTYVERLLHYLQTIDQTNTYIVLVRRKDVDFWKPVSPNFSVQIADFDNYSFAEQIGLKRLLDKLKPDLVHFCMPQQPILYKGTSVTTIHDLILLNTYNSDKNWLVFHIKQLVGRFVFKRVSHKSRYVLTPTQFVKDSVVKFASLPENRVVVTYESAEKTISNTSPYELPFKDFIMYVGQCSDYKNIRRLGEAHQKLLETHPDLGLVLVGKIAKDTEALRAHFQKHDYKNIHFTGFIPDEQRDWLYTKTSAYVFPSLMEGFGLPGLEAMAAGAPVVSSNATCLPEVYGDAAHYFNPLDTDDMSRAINEVLGDPALRETLVKNGYDRLKMYSWQRMAEQTHAVYMEALKETTKTSER